MKKILPALLLLPLLYFAWSAISQKNTIQTLSKENKTLREQIDQQNDEARKTTVASAALKAKTEAFSEESDSLREKIASIEVPAAVPLEAPPEKAEKPPKNPFANMLEKMLKNPVARKALLSQQLTVLKPMYADLVQQLGLAPDKAERFFQILADLNSSALEAGFDARRSDPQALSQSFAASETAFKELLGEDGYQEYMNYQRSIPDRASLTQISAQMTAENVPLRPDQSSGLLQIMQQEQLNTSRFSGAVSTSTPGTFPDPAVLDITFQAQAERNERILARSKTLLSPPQWDAFAQQQKQALAIQKMGIEMARGMFTEEEK